MRRLSSSLGARAAMRSFSSCIPWPVFALTGSAGTAVPDGASACLAMLFLRAAEASAVSGRRSALFTAIRQGICFSCIRESI